MTSPAEAERLCRVSQERADAKRAPSPEPWPERGHRLVTLIGAMIATVIIYALILLTWAVIG